MISEVTARREDEAMNIGQMGLRASRGHTVMGTVTRMSRVARLTKVRYQTMAAKRASFRRELPEPVRQHSRLLVTVFLKARR